MFQVLILVYYICIILCKLACTGKRNKKCVHFCIRLQYVITVLSQIIVTSLLGDIIIIIIIHYICIALFSALQALYIEGVISSIL